MEVLSIFAKQTYFKSAPIHTFLVILLQLYSIYIGKTDRFNCNSFTCLQDWSCFQQHFLNQWVKVSFLLLLRLIINLSWISCIPHPLMHLIRIFPFSFSRTWCVLTNFWFHLQDESHDYIKRQQLRELAMLNSSFREESPGPGGSVSPFNSSGMKRAKTGRWALISFRTLNNFYPSPDFGHLYNMMWIMTDRVT